jgi:hypothetical protein
MSHDDVSILIIVSENDEKGLLEGHPPPRAWQAYWRHLLPAMNFQNPHMASEGETGWTLGDPPLKPDGGGAGGPYMTTYTCGEYALVLAWRGEVAQEGCDRAARRLGLAMHTTWTIEDCYFLAHHAERVFGVKIEVLHV